MCEMWKWLRKKNEWNTVCKNVEAFERFSFRQPSLFSFMSDKKDVKEKREKSKKSEIYSTCQVRKWRANICFDWKCKNYLLTQSPAGANQFWWCIPHFGTHTWSVFSFFILLFKTTIDEGCQDNTRLKSRVNFTLCVNLQATKNRHCIPNYYHIYFHYLVWLVDSICRLLIFFTSSYPFMLFFRRLPTHNGHMTCYDWVFTPWFKSENATAKEEPNCHKDYQRRK